MNSNPGIRSPIVRCALASMLLVLTAAPPASAAGPGAAAGSELARVLLALVIILIAAKLGGDIFVRIGQPAVLGELVFGIIVGNIHLVGFHGLDFIRHDASVHILSEIGVTLLLFQVGLESDLSKMIKVGASSLVVATLGVVAPFFLGWAAAAVFVPDAGVYAHIFIGATLCATSVGITARVMLDLGWIQTSEARIILGAAVIDDVQGLVILAIVSGIIGAASAGAGTLSTAAILAIVAKATLFLFGSLLIGRWVAPRAFHFTSHLRSADLLLTTALGLCFCFAYVATLIDLAPIVGAFAAGLILDEVHWRRFAERGEHSIEELVRPLVALLVPVFFVRMGAGVEISTFANVNVLGFASALTAAAIVGKQVCGLGVMRRGLDRLSVGIGMVPRGEVGLIFASIGSQLRLHGQPIIDPRTFSSVVIMVVVTTMITPPLLKWSVTRSARIRKARNTTPEEQTA